MIFKETKTKTILLEIMQTLDMKMAFVKRQKGGTYTNIHPFVKCRDFLGDALHAVEEKKKVSIYNFTFDGTKKSMYKRKLMLAIQFPNVVSRKNFNTNFYEAMLPITAESGVDIGGYAPTTDPLVVIVEAPVFWQKSVAAISFYTFMLKCCGYKVDNPANMLQEVQHTKVEVKSWDGSVRLQRTTEAEYAQSVSGMINLFVRNIKKLTARLPKVHGLTGDNLNNIHNNAGFVSVIKNRTGIIGQRLNALELK